MYFKCKTIIFVSISITEIFLFLRPVNFITIAIYPFLSNFKYTKLLAAAMFASLVFAYLFFTNYLISVWCFFAAILSLLVILVVVSNRRKVSIPF